MKHITFLGTFLVACLVFAQSDSDSSRVSFFADVVVDSEAVGKLAESALKTKVERIILQNNKGNTENKRFAVLAKVTVVDETTLPTSPAMHKLILDIDLIVADVIEKKSYGIYSFENCVGVNKNKNRAAIQAVSSIKSNKKVQAFLETAKEKILEYYKTHCDFLITEASTLGIEKKYNEAIQKLYDLPKVDEACFYMAQSKIVELTKEREGKSNESLEPKKDLETQAQPEASLPKETDKDQRPETPVKTEHASDSYDWLEDKNNE